MYHSWEQDKIDKLEAQAYLAIMIANPKIAWKICDKGRNKIETSDEDFEKSSRMVKAQKKRQKKLING